MVYCRMTNSPGGSVFDPNAPIFVPMPLDVRWYKIDGHDRMYHLATGATVGHNHDYRVTMCTSSWLYVARHYTNPMINNRCPACVRKYLQSQMEEPVVSTSREAALLATITAAQEELARIASLPKEPSDPQATVTFQIQFDGNSAVYTYAARKAVGRWFVTGPRANRNGTTWDGMVQWIDNMNVDGIGASHLSRVKKVEPLV